MVCAPGCYLCLTGARGINGLVHVSPLAARAREDVRRAVGEAVERDALEPDELRTLAQALRDLASDLCERAGRVAE